MDRVALTPEEWTQVQTVFHDAVDLHPEQREALVRDRLASKPALVARVMALLREDEGSVPLLDHPLGDVAQHVLDDSLPHASQLGRYRVVRPLGRGGMGVVYLVEREDLGRLDALKVLRDAALSPMRRMRFLREQRMLANLVHPGIARLHDADVLPDGTPYFVMEYVDGEPLDVHCAAGELSGLDRVRLFRQVCSAVRFAHEHAVIHRDLKPSNILVTKDGAPKLLDFGIAKDLEDGSGDAATRTRMRLMTPAYAAPEQLLGEAVGVYTDVYSLGVVLYEILAGRPPFDLRELTPSQAERVVLGTVPPAPSSVRRGSPADPPPHGSESGPGRRRSVVRFSASQWADLDVLCATAMHRDASRRYGSVEALIRDLDRFLAREPLEARPDSRTYRLAKFSQRHSRAIAAAAAVMGVVSALSVFYSVRLVEARDRALEAAERTRQIQAFTESLFQGGDGVAGPADTLRVVTLLERGVAEARTLDDDPETQSRMYLTLGTMFSRLGDLDRADTLLSAAHELRDDAEPGERAETGAALGALLLEQGDYAGAELELREAMSLFDEQGEGATLGAALASVSLGTALEGQGEYAEAIDVLSDALVGIERIAPNSAEHSSALAALSTTHFYDGDLDRADSLTLAAIEIDRGLHGERHPTIGHGLINLGAAEAQRGRYLEAEAHFRGAVDIFETFHGSDHLETASALRMLGNNLVSQDRLSEAGESLERALAIQERELSTTHPRLANTLNDLAYIHLQSGRYEESVASYRRVVDMYASSNGPRHYFVAIGLSNLANALSEGGELAEAERIFEDVIDRFGETRGADHLDTGIARIKLGRVLVLRSRPRQAEPHLLAGYEIVSAEVAPTVSWLRAARSDLAAVYDATGRPDQAARWRQEQADVDAAGR